jgi:hypothetical protein
MRLHEFHRIGLVKSMAGVSHPGELIDVPRPVLERYETTHPQIRQALANVRFGARCGLKSDFAEGPKSADFVAKVS